MVYRATISYSALKAVNETLKQAKSKRERELLEKMQLSDLSTWLSDYDQSNLRANRIEIELPGKIQKRGKEPGNA